MVAPSGNYKGALSGSRGYSGGLLSPSGPIGLKGLLGQYFDPKKARYAAGSDALIQAGLAIMNPDPHAPPGGILGTLGRGITGAAQGAEEGLDRFYEDGFRNVQIAELQREQDQRDAQTKAMNALIPSLPPDMQAFARAYPKEFGEAYMKAQMPGEGFTLGEDQVRYGPDGKPIASGPKGRSKPPAVETLYDEKTGQSYKAQWNPATETWERVGGNKADENGITITNPDGTVTQIGGSGTKTTEGDRRANLLIQQIVSQEPQLMASFDTLATTQNAIGGAAGTPGRAVMSGEAQIAKDSITNVVANWLYLTSGATATDDEVARQTAMVTPTVFDKPENIAAKKARLQSIIDTMKIRGNVQPSKAPNNADALRQKYNLKPSR